MVQDPSQLQEIKQQQHQRQYTMYHQFNAHRTGGRNERTTYPKCINIGIHRLHLAPDGLYRGPLAECPEQLPEARTEQELFGENSDVESSKDEGDSE
jgi:hypothetical protein